MSLSKCWSLKLFNLTKNVAAPEIWRTRVKTSCSDLWAFAHFFAHVSLFYADNNKSLFFSRSAQYFETTTTNLNVTRSCWRFDLAQSGFFSTQNGEKWGSSSGWLVYVFKSENNTQFWLKRALLLWWTINDFFRRPWPAKLWPLALVNLQEPRIVPASCRPAN